MSYQFKQWRAAREDFRRRFAGLTFGDFYDGYVTLFTGMVHIDIVKLDEYFHRKFGDYEDRGLSLDDFVREKYGEEALALLNELTINN
jgi:hypothetical protein